MLALQCRHRPRKSRYESTGMLSRQAIGVPHSMHADAGETIDARRGTRAATTFRKLPSASPGASETRADSILGDYRRAERSCLAREQLGRVQLRVNLAVRRHSRGHGVDDRKGVGRQVVAEQNLTADDRTVDVDVVAELDDV